jgi:hypothetical protein
MNKYPIPKIGLPVSFILLLGSMLACNFPIGIVSDCEVVDREEYIMSAQQLGETPETPKYPDGAVYKVCYTDQQLTSVRMTDGEKPDEEVPVGTYTGESSFHTLLDNDVDNSFLEPVCTENIVRVVVGSDGTVNGEIRSICYANRDTDNEEMRTVHHAEVTGVITGKLLEPSGQLTIDYTWHEFFTSPQWETTSLDHTNKAVFPYHVRVSENVMTLTPAADVEAYYTFTLRKQ